MLKIHVTRCLTAITEPSLTLGSLKQTNLIMIDEMYMMTNIVLCVIGLCLKQSFEK
jgi:hypothetical protein